MQHTSLPIYQRLVYRQGSGPADIHIHDDRFLQAGHPRSRVGAGRGLPGGEWTANRLDEFLAVAQETNLADHVKPSPALLKLAEPLR